MELPFNTVYSKDILGNHVETAGRRLADQAGLGRLRLRRAVGRRLLRLERLHGGQGQAQGELQLPRQSVARQRPVGDRRRQLRAHLGRALSEPARVGRRTSGALKQGELPLGRGMRPTPHQLLVREMILQLKTGRLDAGYFRHKFGVEILDEWRDVWREYQDDGYLTIDGDAIQLTRDGLLRVDGLLPAFFEPEHRGVRYT